MDQIIEMIKELFELYDDYGSEMPEPEVNFIKLLITKAQKVGLSTEKLSGEDIDRIRRLHYKYSQLEAYDSNESDGRGGNG